MKLGKLHQPPQLVHTLISLLLSAAIVHAQTPKPSASQQASPPAQPKSTQQAKASAISVRDDPDPNAPTGNDDAKVSGLSKAGPRFDSFTGLLTMSLPIESQAVGPGPAPTVALIYQSVRGNGWVGQGWDLETGAIERSTRYGVNYNSNDYILKMAGSSVELVSTGNDEYRALVEQAFFRIRRTRASDQRPSWEVTSKDGTRYFFGQTQLSRQDNPEDADQIFRWSLDRIEDPRGNYLTISHFKAEGAIYPQRIDYAGGTNVAPNSYMQFYLESRSDAPDLYSLNFRVRTAFRLKSIAIFSENILVRAYKLTYKTSISTSRSLLTQAIQFGKDANVDANGNVIGGTALPPVDLGWHEQPNSFGRSATSSPIDPGSDANRFWADVNGDGRTDYCRVAGDTNFINSHVRCVLSTGNGFGQEITSSVIDWGFVPGRAWTDFNGDGKADYCRVVGGPNHTNAHVRCLLSTGNGFGQEVTSPAIDWGFEHGRAWADFNGDGKADYCRVVGGPNHTNAFVRCLLSTGTGFGPEVTSPTLDWGFESGRAWVDVSGDGKADYCRLVGGPNHVNSLVRCTLSATTAFGQEVTSAVIDWGFEAGRSWADVNGDSRADYCRVVGGPNHTNAFVRCLLSTGTGFGPEVTSPTLDWGFESGRAWVDVSGDGKADYCRLVGGPNHTNAYARCLISVGSGFDQEVTSATMDWGYEAGRAWVDINGDGRADYGRVVGGHVEGYFVRYTEAFPPVHDARGDLLHGDLLGRLSNGLGGTTQVEYVSSTHHPNTLLPFHIPTVSEITTNDGTGIDSTTLLSYSGGYYHLQERDFRGFSRVKVTGPQGPAGERAVLETWFHQGNDSDVGAGDPASPVGYMKGKPFRIVTTDRDGRTFQGTTVSYKADTVAPHFNPPARIDTSICDGSDCTRTTRKAYSYDNYGNVTREFQYGDLNDNSDDRLIVREFSANVNSWMVGLLIAEAVYKGIGAPRKIASVNYYYDGNNTCLNPSTNRAPSVGNLTRIAPWNGNGVSPHTLMAYDSRGNLVCKQDPNGNITRLTYDTRSQVPLLITDPLNQTIQMRYYGVNSVPSDNGIYGQVKSTSDPNGAQIDVEYDVFGRKTRVDLPNGNWTRFSYIGLGNPNAQNIQVDSASGLQSWSYFDGFGKVTTLKKSGPGGNLIAVKNEYDNRGLLRRSSLPYFDGAQQPVFRSFTYDPMGRVILTQNPDGTSRESCYHAGVEVLIDESGHRTRRTSNVAGKLTRVDEYKGVFSSPCTTSEDVDPVPAYDAGAGLPNSPYATTTYTYDVMSNLVKLTDAKLGQVTLTYDHLNRRSSIVDPNIGAHYFYYDANGNLTKSTDSKEQSIYYQYDALNRLVQKDYGSIKSPAKSDVRYEYDAPNAFGRGRLAAVRQKHLTTRYRYDAVGQIIQTDRIIDEETYITKSEYDFAGRISVLTYPNGDRLKYRYDGPFLESVYDAQITYAAYRNHNALGQAGDAIMGNNTMTNFRYSHLNNQDCRRENYRLCSLEIRGPGGQSYRSNSYAYDNTGNLTAIREQNGDARSFSYDEMDRLVEARTSPRDPLANTPHRSTEAHHPSKGGRSLVNRPQAGDAVEQFRYDEIGNMTWSSKLGEYVYAADRPQVVTLVEGDEYKYDNNGNLIRGAGRSLSYDFENRLTKVRLHHNTTTFLYDDVGNRVKKVVKRSLYNAADSIVRGKMRRFRVAIKNNRTVYIGNLYECDSGGCTKNIWAGANKIARQTAGNRKTTFIHTDHQGSVTLLTDERGMITQTFSYGPYGDIQNEAEDWTVLDDLGRFTGHEFDASTGLYYYGARYYDPVLGRFTSPDPIVPIPGIPRYLNRYSYVLNNPATLIDPDGHFAFAAILIGAAIGAAIGGTVAALRGGNVWQGIAIGAITGAFTGGAGALIGPGTGLALQATLYAAGGAAAGATTAALYGGDIGRGALIGAAAGLAGYALGGIDTTLMESGVPLANFASSSLKGALIGGAYAGMTGMDIWDGMLAGAASGAIGEAINVGIGHAAGFIASGGKAPLWEKGVFIYDAPNEYFSIGNVWTGRGNLDQPYTATVGLGEKRRFTVRQHEMGHSEQSTWLGGWYIPMHGLSKLVGEIRGDSHMFGPLEGYSPWHSAPMQQCCK